MYQGFLFLNKNTPPPIMITAKIIPMKESKNGFTLALIKNKPQ